jgi:hypothetical protein
MKIILTFLLVTILLAWLKAGGTTARAGYATAPYKVVRTDGKFELRDYPVLTVAETPMRGADNAFMRLFHFIGGKNATQQKIAMTTPVFISHAGGTNAAMAFVMPEKTRHQRRAAADRIRRGREAGSRRPLRCPAFFRLAQREKFGRGTRPIDGVAGAGKNFNDGRTGVRVFRPAMDAAVLAAERNHASRRAAVRKIQRNAGDRAKLSIHPPSGCA